MGEDVVVSSASSAADSGMPLLVERPKIRWFWFGILAFMAAVPIAVVVWLTISPGEGGDPGGEWFFVGFALLMLAFGLGLLRVSIIADSSGVTVTNLYRSRTIPWGELDDVGLVEVEAAIQFGLHQLALVTRDGELVQTAATGFIRPGCRLEQLQHDLLAMRDRYSSK
jgi:hypothetical protein